MEGIADRTYHILNGDALLERLPASIPGHRIVFRECLVDGTVQGETLEELYATRAEFLGSAYPGESEAAYHENVVPELNRIPALPGHSGAVLWFEDDLFCQVNLWFVAHMLCETGKAFHAYLVRPTASLQYGFGGMDEAAFWDAMQKPIILDAAALKVLVDCWLAYQAGDLDALQKLASENADRFPFLPKAVQAEVDRHPDNDGAPGAPERILLEAMEEHGSDDFGPVYQHFWKHGAIYGFGDLQVKRLFDQLKV